MNLALFDFDGTITNADMYTKFIRFSSIPWRSVIGNIVLMPFFYMYKLGLFPVSKLRIMTSYFAFARRDFETLDSDGANFARDIIPNYLRKNAIDRIHWHKSNGDEVVIVSASLDIYLKHWCMRHGLILICSQLEVVNGIFSGRYISGDCCSITKSKRIKDMFDLEKYERIYAYGDTTEDLDMLELAHEKYMNWEPKIDDQH